VKDGTEPATWKVYRCLNAEIDLEQKKYILNDGDWYNVDGNYVISAECFLDESTFRDKLNHLLPVGFKLSDTSLAPVAKQHIVCLAIMSKVKGPLEIPFFSKVSLKHAVKALRKMDFKVTKLKIER
jgi:uncharacterized protein DUF6119